MTRLIPLALALMLGGCETLTGPLVDQSPEKQAVADKVHQYFMDNVRGYRTESGVKILVSCLAWDRTRLIGAYGTQGYYYPVRYAALGRNLRELERQAIGDCEAKVPPTAEECTCAPVDINGRNAVKVP